MALFSSLKEVTFGKYVGFLPSLNAVTGTTSVMRKCITAAQTIGFVGGILALAACFAVMSFASERWREKLKSHIGWALVAVVGLFAVSALATLAKQYSQSSFG